ncbi:MAG: hypothetical protein R3E83_16870 [Burkholderiaceae bacterium]
MSAIASTPAVGPRPTTLTNSSAQTSSGTLRRNTSNQRTPWRTSTLVLCIGRPRADCDRRALAIRVSGTEAIHPSSSPAVAVATVIQVACSTRRRNSGEICGGKKVARKRPVIFSER